MCPRVSSLFSLTSALCPQNGFVSACLRASQTQNCPSQGPRPAASLTCMSVRSDSTYDCSVSSRVMVTCFRMSWGNRRQRLSRAHGCREPSTPSLAFEAYLSTIQSCWLFPQGTLDCHHARSLLWYSPCRERPPLHLPATPECPLTPPPDPTHGCPLADLEISCLLLGSPAGLLKRTEKIKNLSHLQNKMPPGHPLLPHHSSCQF